MSTRNTKERILDAAERLFSQRGYSGTSVRAITSAAEVNLAAANYHFGSKEELLCAVVDRRIAPITEERARLLADCEADAGAGGAELEQILHAFVAPAFVLSDGTQGSGAFARLLGRLYAEPLEGLARLYEEQCGPVLESFCEAFSRALPGLPKTELYWHLQFVIGMLVHTFMAGERVRLCTEGLCDLDDMPSVIERMVHFAAAGLREAAVGLQQTADTRF